jgi:hypothetical protein
MTKAKRTWWTRTNQDVVQDAVVIVLFIAGIIICASAIVIGYYGFMMTLLCRNPLKCDILER